MVKPNELPEELKKEQEVLSVKGGKACFYCFGEGTLHLPPGSNVPMKAPGQKSAKESILRSKSGRRFLVVNADKPFVGKGPQWLYQDETLSGGWEPFDWEMCRKLDEAYQEGAGAVCRIGAVDGAWIDRGGPMNVEGPAHGRGGVVSEIDFSDMTLRQVGHGGVVSQGWVMARWWVTVRGVYPKIATQNTASVLPTAPTSERCLPLSTILRHDLERMIEPIQPAPTRATLRPNRHPSPGWVGPRGTQD